MPLDPRISLGVQVPASQSPMDRMGKNLTLKNLMQRQKMNQMDIAAAEFGQNEQRIVQGTFQESGGDLQKTIAILGSRGGVSPQTMVKLQGFALDQEDKKLAVFKTRTGLLAQGGQAILGAAPSVKAQVLSQVVGAWEANKILPPEVTAQLRQMPPEQMDAEMQALISQSMTAMQQMEERRAQSTQKLDQEKFAEAKRATGVTEQRLANPPPTEAILAERAAKGDSVAAKALQTLQARKQVPGVDVPYPPDVFKQRQALRTPTGAEGLPLSAPYTGTAKGAVVTRDDKALITAGATGAEASLVKAMVAGKYPMPTGRAATSPGMQRLLYLAAIYEPGFDATQWRVRLDTRADFAKGNGSRQVRSLNTLVKHLGTVWDAADKLDNKSLKAWNRAGNVILSETGSARLKDWQTSATAAATEMAALLKGGAAPTEMEITEQLKAFDINDSKEQQRQAILGTLELAFGRMNALQDQWRNAFRGAEEYQFLNSDAKKILTQKVGVKPTQFESADTGAGTAAPAVSVTDPKGGVHTFPNQAAADAFKKAAGIP